MTSTRSPIRAKVRSTAGPEVSPTVTTTRSTPRRAEQGADGVHEHRLAVQVDQRQAVTALERHDPDGSTHVVSLLACLAAPGVVSGPVPCRDAG